jgi:hypothetical protein
VCSFSVVISQAAQRQRELCHVGLRVWCLVRVERKEVKGGIHSKNVVHTEQFSKSPLGIVNSGLDGEKPRHLPPTRAPADQVGILDNREIERPKPAFNS